MKIEETSLYSNDILTEVNKHILGKEEVLKKVLISLLANGHILFEDFPGLAKTQICRCFAATLGCSFKRIQFTPDLLPQDITGSEIFNQQLRDFEFKPGPIFSNIILADEINRATPKTQSALLEAMGEYQVSIGGTTYQLTEDGSPFVVVATQNPLELEGTFALPEAQLDRFISKISIGYPSQDIEIRILKNRMDRRKKDFDVAEIINATTFSLMQKSVEQVFVSDEILEYITAIVMETRDTSQVKVGASPRGSLDLLAMARSSAALDNRDYVNPEDVKSSVFITIGHRLVLEISSWVGGTSVNNIITSILQKVKAPRKSE